MGKNTKTFVESQLEFDFDDASVSAVDMASKSSNKSRRARELPVLPVGEELDMVEQVDLLLQQIGKANFRNLSALSRFILRSFYVEGQGVTEISQMLKDGVKDVRPVTRERVRMIVSDIRDELLTLPSTRKYFKDVNISSQFVDRLKKHSEENMFFLIEKSCVKSPKRIGTIAFLMHKRAVTGDTVIRWVKNQVFMLDDGFDKQLFNEYYLALFYLLQKYARPMSKEAIIREFSENDKLQSETVNIELLDLLLQHDEVFERIDENLYQLRFEHLNVSQRIARIIYEMKEVTPADLQRVYEERVGERFSNNSSVSRVYPWCVPVGKSKWVYREDCRRERKPADIISSFCREHVRFAFDDVMLHLNSLGFTIKESSVRCYILRDCRRLNSDSNMFCLTSNIPENEEHLWYSKMKPSVKRKRVVSWREEMVEDIRRLLASAPDGRLRRIDVLHHCMPMFRERGMAYNNFYKILKTVTSFETVEIDGEVYLEIV